MKRVLTAVVLIPLVLLVVFRAPLWLFSLVVALIVILALREYLNLLQAYGLQPLRKTTYVMALLLVLGTLSTADVRLMEWFFFLHPLWHDRGLPILIILPFVVGIPLIFRKDLRGSLPAAAGSAFGILYIALTLSLLISLRCDWNLCVLVVFILFSVWAGDTAAYYVGRTFGRHPLAPVVSPKKTWEGATASVVASVVMAWIVFHFYPQIRNLFSPPPPLFYTPISILVLHPRIALTHVVVLGVLTNVAAQMGDLFESAIKRGAQVKDSGSLLPGHGGVLDRIDALLFAIPTVWYYAMLTQFLQPVTF